MAYDENKGALFFAKEKKDPKHADFTGTVNIDGREYYLNGWKNKSKKGEKYIGLSVKPKDPKPRDDGWSENNPPPRDDFDSW